MDKTNYYSYSGLNQDWTFTPSMNIIVLDIQETDQEKEKRKEHKRIKGERNDKYYTG